MKSTQWMGQPRTILPLYYPLHSLILQYLTSLLGMALHPFNNPLHFALLHWMCHHGMTRFLYSSSLSHHTVSAASRVNMDPPTSAKTNLTLRTLESFGELQSSQSLTTFCWCNPTTWHISLKCPSWPEPTIFLQIGLMFKVLQTRTQGLYQSWYMNMWVWPLHSQSWLTVSRTCIPAVAWRLLWENISNLGDFPQGGCHSWLGDWLSRDFKVIFLPSLSENIWYVISIDTYHPLIIS